MAGTDNGLVHLSSKYSVDETVKRLEDLLQVQGIKEFCRVDHSGEAEKAGLTMRSTKVIIFGNPKGGTPLMLAAPSIAIDLPFEGVDLGRPRRKSLAFVQQSGISSTAAQPSARPD